MNLKQAARARRKKGIRKYVSGTATVPRLSVFRSNRYIYAQLIDDAAGKTLVGTNDRSIKAGSPMEKATQVGTEIAKIAQKFKVKKIVFDRGGYRYHGRVKALADGAREAGLEF
jgi:large subunit ribosomal protein L18